MPGNKIEHMRCVILFFAILFFEKNAVAVVRASVENHTQLVETQSVKLSKRLERTHGNPFFLKKTRLSFFKKRTSFNQHSHKKDGHLDGVLSLVFGLLALCSSILTVMLLSGGFILAWAVCGVLSIILGVVAITKKFNSLKAWLGISLSVISLIVGILLAIAFWEAE